MNTKDKTPKKGASVIPFRTKEQPEAELPDFDTMNFEELTAYQKKIEAQIAALDTREPRNMNSEAYEEWADAHEELEDLLDEILDLLDDLNN